MSPLSRNRGAAVTEEAGTDVIAALIQALVDNEDEVKRAKDIIKANDARREVLRDAMIEAGVIEAVDEVSGHRVMLKQNQRDAYVPDKLLPILANIRQELIDEVYYRMVDAERVKGLIDGGILTRAQLQRDGALVREPTTKPYIKLEALKGVRP